MHLRHRRPPFFRRLFVSSSLAAIGSCLAIQQASAQPNFEELAKVVAGDASAQAQLGFSVAISGDTAVVGVPGDNGFRGSAYVLERNQGGPDAWGVVTKLEAPDAAEHDRFGEAVAIEGDTVVVGSQLDDDKGSDSGSAYLFLRDRGGADQWGQVAKLTAADGAVWNWFGLSVAVDGDVIVVGAPRNASNTGAAYVFLRDQGGAENWGQVRKLVSLDKAANDQFGRSVAVDGHVVLVGAHRDDDNGTDSGSAYVFARDYPWSDGWGQVLKLTASDGAAGDYFGYAVAFGGDFVVIGAPNDDDRGNNAGAAYVFNRDGANGGSWSQAKKLYASDPHSFDFFGYSVSASGDTALVGAYRNAGKGSAYLFGRHHGGSSNWGEFLELLASDGAQTDHFGYAVGIAGPAGGETAIVGAPLDDETWENPGAAYVFGGQ